MSNLNDDLSTGAVITFIWAFPKLLGITILAVPFLIISYIIDVPTLTLVKNLLAFATAVFLVLLFSKYQIIENGIVGLILGLAVYVYFKWHPVACILIGIATTGLLFLLPHIKIGFWIKTISFSLLVTLTVYTVFYSKWGLLTLPDMVWKITFFITFLLENLFIRCSVAYNNE